jgi:hypothetical protein
MPHTAQPSAAGRARSSPREAPRLARRGGLAHSRV